MLLGYMQDELEKATMSLDKSLMTDINRYKLAEIEKNYKYCEERRRIVVDQVAEDEDFLEYNDDSLNNIHTQTNTHTTHTKKIK